MFLAKMEYPLRLDIYARQSFCLVFNYNPGRIDGLTIKGFLKNLQKLYEGVTSGAYRTVGELLSVISI
jgi:hypothetical protein